MKSRKGKLPSVMFSFLAAAAGIYVIRFFLSGGDARFALLIGVALSAVYFAVKACTNHRMQAQMIVIMFGGEKPKIKIREYLKSIGLTAFLSVLKLTELVIYEILPLSMIALLFFAATGNALSLGFCIAVLIGAAVLAATGFVFYSFSVQKYARAPFIFAAYPLLGIKDIIRLSAESGEKRAAELLRFKLGFLPWLLSCAAIIPLLYVVPYYKQSLTCYFKQEF